MGDDGARGHYVHLSYHKWMLEDEARMAALTAMVSTLVRPGDVVADLGTGTGILALLAKEAGAARVYGVEASPIVRLARRMLAMNGVQDVTLLEGDMTTVQLPEPVDVVFSECLGNLAFGDRMFRKVGAFAARWLKPGGRRGPQRVRLFAQAADCRLFGDPRPFWRRPYRGLDLSAFLPAVESEVSVVDVVPSFLFDAPSLLLDFDPYERADHYVLTGSWSLPTGRVCNAVALWFDVDWAPGVTMSTSARAPATHWAQVILRVPERPTEAGDRLEFALRVDFDEEETPLYRWSGHYVTATGARTLAFHRRASDPFSLDEGA